MDTSPAVWFVGKRRVEIRREQVGPVGPQDVRVRAVLSAISHGTEMLVYRGEVPPQLALDLPTLAGSFAFPIKYGYASAGTVVEAGRAVSHLAPGDRVFVLHPHQAEYVVPASLAVPLPPPVTPECGVFVANLETALNALLDAPVRLGETALVVGQGVVGLLIMQLLKLSGAEAVVTVDPVRLRREASLRLGAGLALDSTAGLPAEVRSITGGRGADVVFEASGSAGGLQQAIQSVATEGTVVVCSWYGSKRVELSLGEDFHRRRIRLRSSQVGGLDPSLSPRWDRERRISAVLDLLPRLRLAEMISHRFPVEDAVAAYRLVDEHPEETVQVALTYQGGE